LDGKSSIDTPPKIHKYLSIQLEAGQICTSGKKAIGGAPFWPMRGAYGMRHQCHATSNSLSVAHLKMRHA
jgi:hypothetical protein